jgi:hypothetical protein
MGTGDSDHTSTPRWCWMSTWMKRTAQTIVYVGFASFGLVVAFKWSWPRAIVTIRLLPSSFP